MVPRRLRYFLLSLILMLAACSGGGGDGLQTSSDRVLVLTADNADEVMFDIFLDLDELLARLIQELTTIDSITSADSYAPYTCNDPATGSFIGVNPNAQVDNGDTFSASFTQCVETGAGDVLDGMVEFEMLAGTDQTPPAIYVVRVTLSDFSIGQDSGSSRFALSLNGAIDLTYVPDIERLEINSPATVSLRYVETEVATGNLLDEVLERYTLDILNWSLASTGALFFDVAGELDSDIYGGQVEFETADPNALTVSPITRDPADSFPTGGSFALQGANNALYAVTASDVGVGVDAVLQYFDADGDGSQDLGPALVPTWTAISNEAPLIFIP